MIFQQNYKCNKNLPPDHVYATAKAVGTVFGLGGGGNKNFARRRRAIFFYITLTYKKDTLLFISISVISKIH